MSTKRTTKAAVHCKSVAQPAKKFATKQAPTRAAATAEIDAANQRQRAVGKPPRVNPATTAKPPTKQNVCLALLSRADGASVADLQTATGWLPHSVRGFLAGTVKKKLGLSLISSRQPGATRRYRIDLALTANAEAGTS